MLIVEDEDNARKGYEQLLQKWGYDVLGVATAEDALAKFGGFQPDSLIADVELPGMNGLDLLKQLGNELRNVPAIIITGKGSEERAVAAIESGAFWYIEKPLKAPIFHALLDRCLDRARPRQVAVLRRQLRETGRVGDIIGSSKPMQEVMRIVEKAAPSSASVLITGETGTARKSWRAVFTLLPRAAGPFVAINCAAIPTLMESEIFGHERGAFTGAAEGRIGWFELADGGTLLLDEIGEMPARRRPSCCACWRIAKSAASAAKPKLRRRSRPRRDQQGSRSRPSPRPVAPGSLLPPERLSHPLAAAARPQRRHSAARRALHQRRKRQARKNVRGIGPKCSSSSCSYSWPGNIRELRNFSSARQSSANTI